MADLTLFISETLSYRAESRCECRRPFYKAVFLPVLQLLAPSIGNIHGRYINPPNFRLDLLDELQKEVGPGTASNSILVLHGTDDLPDELFKDCIRRGAIKINVNSWARDPQVKYW